MLRYEVPPQADGERLDRFLAGAQADMSRNRLQALIRDGQVRVNGRPARVSSRLRSGDEVAVELPEAIPTTLLPEPLALVIVHQDEHVLVVDKPAGLVVHPGAGVTQGTLVHGLLHLDPAIARVGGTGRPGIVHRLDKDTSGLMVVARTERAYRGLIDAMRRRQVRRTYLALAWGDVHGESGTIEAAIGRDPRERKRMAEVRRGGRPAVTHWRVLERFGPATWLEVRLETGRTHQIRVHLAARRHPLVGDPIYGGRPKKQLSGNDAERSLAAALLTLLTRQALHASELGFTHPVTGDPLHLVSPPPHDLTLALDRLRAHARTRR